MAHDVLEDRRKALEEQFFREQNEHLVRKLRDSKDRAATREELKRVTGIRHEAVLDALAAMKLGTAATLIMSMYPLVEVAWADGAIDQKERQVLLEQSSGVGIKQGTEAALFLVHWLDERPEPSWHDVWADYVRELTRAMKPDDVELLRAEVLGRARLVAEASGGVLGFGFSMSAAEKKCLENLAMAFTVAA